MARGLVCDNCGAEYPEEPRWLCERCFELLRVRYEAEEGKPGRRELADREMSLWRYRERLPVDRAGASEVGWTRLVEAKHLGERLGLERVYIKDEGTGSPTGCVEDRGAAVAAAKSQEFGYEAVACATMGAGAAPVAAACARAGVRCYVFAPPGGEREPLLGASKMGAKVVLLDGRREEAERFCRDAADEYGWGFLNLHLKPYWAEGIKTLFFEVAEQLGWKLPDQFVIYVGSGVLAKESAKAEKELRGMGIEKNRGMRVYGVQLESCAPIARALSNDNGCVTAWEGSSTAGPSDPAWGKAAAEAIRRSKGTCQTVSKEEAEKGGELLAETEGLLRGVRTGASVWATKKLAENGKLRPEAVTVIAATERPVEEMRGSARSLRRIRPRLSDFDKLMRNGFG